MGYSLEKLKELRQEYLEEYIPLYVSKVSDPRFSRGLKVNSLIAAYETAALADYILDKNIQSYREYIHKCALLQYDLIKRWKDGDASVEFKYIKAGSRPLTQAFITGDFDLVQKLIELTNLTIETKEQKKVISSGELNMYRLIRYLCGDYETEKEALEALDLLRKEIKNKGTYKAYLDLMEATIKKDQSTFDEAMKGVLKSHRFLCRKGSFYADTPDEILSHAGINKAVIGVLKGMEFNLESEQIPKDLVLGLADLAKKKL